MYNFSRICTKWIFQFLFFPQRKERAFLSDLSLHFPFNIYIPQWRLLCKLESYSSLQFGMSYVNIDYISSLTRTLYKPLKFFEDGKQKENSKAAFRGDPPPVRWSPIGRNKVQLIKGLDSIMTIIDRDTCYSNR